MERWAKADVMALAPDLRALEAADDLAVGSLWRGLGCDANAVWGLYHGATAEPYQVVITLAGPRYRCTCPSRQRPCKHTLALLLLWADGVVLGAAPPGFAVEAIGRDAAPRGQRPVREADADPESEQPPRARRPRTGASTAEEHDGPPPPDARALEKAARVGAGLREFEQWMTDAVRTGLTAPALAQYGTWDAVAARLVDAQAPSLANRVRRLAGAVGTRPAWHEHVLAEFGTLHLLCSAGQRLFDLDRSHPALAESVRTALGRTIRQADVLAGPAEPDLWMVCGCSQAIEERFAVRREWLRSIRSHRWAMVLSFAAGGQGFGERLPLGAVVAADMFRYPGLHELRCIPDELQVTAPDDAWGGESSSAPNRATGGVTPEPVPGMGTIAAACAEVGAVLAELPWIERWPVTVCAAPARVSGRWVLSDRTGSLAIAGGLDPSSATAGAGGAVTLATLVALSGGRSLNLTCEWTPSGLVPLTVHLPTRTVDVGPVAIEAALARGVA